MNRDQLTEELQKIGLTQYQSDAYIEAVNLGSSPPTDLAEVADVPRGRIYDVINDLETMGLVEIYSRSGGKEVNALAPEIALDEFKRRQFEDIENTIQSASSTLSRLYEHEQETQGFITMVRLKESALRHIRQAINEADWWLNVVIDPELYTEIADELNEAIDRGVAVRLVIQDNTDEFDSLEFPESMQVRYRPPSDIIIAADRSYGIFSGTAPARLPLPYIVTRERNHIHLFQNYCELIWSSSPVLREGNGFPQWFLEPRYFINNFEDELREETFTARVTGNRPGERITDEWTGTIVAYEMSSPYSTDSVEPLYVDASFDIETEDEVLSVGGWKANKEDIAAHAVEISRSE